MLDVSPSPSPSPSPSDSLDSRVRAHLALSPDSARPSFDRELRSAILQGASRIDPMQQGWIADLRTAYPQAFLILSACGADPLADTAVENRHMPGTFESFSNVGRHCVAVGQVCAVIAYELLARGIINAEQAHTAVMLGLIHDAGKPDEIMRKKAGVPDAYSVREYDAFCEHLAAQSPGISNYLELVRLAGKITGHGSLSRFLEGGDGSTFLAMEHPIEQLITHIADDMVHSTKPGHVRAFGDQEIDAVLPLAHRMVASGFNLESSQGGYPWMWKEGVAWPPTVSSYPVWLGHYAYLQSKAFDQFSILIASKLGLAAEDASTASAQLADFVANRLPRPGQPVPIPAESSSAEGGELSLAIFSTNITRRFPVPVISVLRLDPTAAAQPAENGPLLLRFFDYESDNWSQLPCDGYAGLSLRMRDARQSIGLGKFWTRLTETREVASLKELGALLLYSSQIGIRERTSWRSGA